MSPNLILVSFPILDTRMNLKAIVEQTVFKVNTGQLETMHRRGRLSLL